MTQATIPFHMVDPTRDEVLQMQPQTAFKDVSHFATALKSWVDYLVSRDRKQMIEIRDLVYTDLELRILLPAELIDRIRELG